MSKRRRGPKPRYRKVVILDTALITNSVTSDTLFTVGEGEELTLERIIMNATAMKTDGATSNYGYFQVAHDPGGDRILPTLATGNYEVVEPKKARSNLIHGVFTGYLQGEAHQFNFDIKTRRKLEEGDTITLKNISTVAGYGNFRYAFTLIMRIK